MIDFTPRWTQDWALLGLDGDPACLHSLLASYAEPGRHYHTLQHLSECLASFAQLAHLAERAGEVAIALWFHDVVYVPLAVDNEARSAACAEQALRAAGADGQMLARVRALIMATAHHGAPADHDARLVVDIDLAILGAGRQRFAQYQQQVRAEYAAVPASVYASKRKEVLARFLAQPAIYNTPAMHARLEAQARSNLQQAIAE